MTGSFDVFFILRLNKRLSKHWWGWWFETPSCPLWRHSNDYGYCTSVANTSIKHPYIVYRLLGWPKAGMTDIEWRHMSIMTTEITGNIIVCSTALRLTTKTTSSSALHTFDRESTDEWWFPSQRGSNAKRVSIWWYHHRNIRFFHEFVMQSTWSVLLTITPHFIDGTYAYNNPKIP